MDVGATLRQARESRKLSSEDIARATRIPLRLILAIEKDDWTKVPEGIFARGYLKAYAREVRVDEGPLLAQFEAAHAPAIDEPRADDGENEDTRASTRWPRRTSLWEQPRLTLASDWPRWSLPREVTQHFQWPALVTVLLLVVYLFAGRTSPDGAVPGTPSDAASATATSALGTQTPPPVATTATATGEGGGLAAAEPSVDRPMAIEIAVSRPCWVALTVDGSRAVYRVVQPGERERHEGRVFVLRAGDAGALQLSVDGRPSRAVGSSGQVVTMRVTRENYKSLLQSGPPGTL